MPVTPPAPVGNLRRFLTRTETVTLLGMIVCISSLFLPWPALTNFLLPAPALHIDLTLRGQSIPAVRWPMTIAALLGGMTLMFSTEAKNRLPLSVFQGLCGLVCFVISLTRFAMLPGVIVGLIGGALLTFGAVDRFTQSAVPNTSTISDKRT